MLQLKESFSQLEHEKERLLVLLNRRPKVCSINGKDCPRSRKCVSWTLSKHRFCEFLKGVYITSFILKSQEVNLDD